MKPNLGKLIVVVVTLLASTPLLAQGDAAPAETSVNLFQLIMQGGWAMIPLAVVLFVMCYLLFYCAMETRKGQFVPANVLPKATSDLQMRDIHSATITLQSADSVLSRTLSKALLKARTDWEDCARERVEMSFVEALDSEESNISQWVNYLNVVAAISPMIGLLGTVSGMIGAFQTIGAGGMGDPAALAGDIGQALITTATGLVISIPAMVGYFWLKNRLSTRMIETADATSQLIDYMAGDYNYAQGETTEYEHAAE